MDRHGQQRTTIALIIFMLHVGMNTAFAVALDDYSTWFAWLVLGVAALTMVLVLRYPQRFTILPAIVVMVLPFILAAGGAFLHV